MTEKTFKKKLHKDTRWVQMTNGILIGLPEGYVFSEKVTISGIRVQDTV